MLRTTLIIAITLMSYSFVFSQSDGSNASATKIKEDILELARSYAGQGDPDSSKQRALEQLVDKLLLTSPPPPLKDRLPLVHGAWKQVWGPYDYRGNKRGVDRELGVDEIYQVVFPDGFYYNVSPLFKKGDRNQERIGLLKGRYKPDPKNENVLLVKFLEYPGLKARPVDGTKLFEIPALVESRKLKSDTSIVPRFVVSLFFGGGALREVYTDNDLRILYGAGSNKFKDKYLYVMTRVGNVPTSR